MNSILWKIINRDHLGRTDSQISRAKTKNFLTDENGAGVEMLVDRDQVMQIFPPRIGCGHGKAPRVFDFRDAEQRPLQVLHNSYKKTISLHVSGFFGSALRLAVSSALRLCSGLLRKPVRLAFPLPVSHEHAG
jgi:hypothetical protein